MGHIVGKQDDEMRGNIVFERFLSRVEARSSQITWFRVKASRLESQASEHAHMSGAYDQTNLFST